MTVLKIENGTGQKVVAKIKLKFEGYKNCLEATRLEDEINHRKIN